MLVTLSVSHESNWLEEYFFTCPGEIEFPDGEDMEKDGDLGLFSRVLDNDKDWKRNPV